MKCYDSIDLHQAHMYTYIFMCIYYAHENTPLFTKTGNVKQIK